MGARLLSNFSRRRAHSADPGGARLVLAGFLVCSSLGLIFASHFRLYHEIDWHLALWWGLKDWYLWGALAPAVFWLNRRLPLSRGNLPRALATHFLAAFALAWVHPTLAICLSTLAEGVGDASFFGAVEGLFLKRYGWSFVTYGVIAVIAQSLASRRRGQGSDDPMAGDRSTRRREVDQGAPAERLLVRKGEREYFLEVDRIDRIEAEGNYAAIHSGEETYLERRTLKSLESQLDSSRFLRIHRSHIVNLTRVDRIEAGFKGRYQVVLRDGASLPLSRTYRKRLVDRVGASL